MRYIIYILFPVLLIVFTGKANSQSILNLDENNNNSIYLRFGVDPASMITFGFQHKTGLAVLKQPLVFYGEWKVSATRFAFKNSDLCFGSILPLIKSGSFMIVNNLNLSAGSLATHNFISRKFAAGDEILIGLYKKNWFIASLASYDKIYLNNIEHTSLYRRLYYEDAKDGWYKGAGGSFQFGIKTGVSIKSIIDLAFEMKIPFTEKFNAYGGSPAHISVELGYRF